MSNELHSSQYCHIRLLFGLRVGWSMLLPPRCCILTLTKCTVCIEIRPFFAVKYHRSPDLMVWKWEGGRHRERADRPGCDLCLQLAALSVQLTGTEGQPALCCCSSSGTVLNECVEWRKLVRLQLTCSKQSRQPESNFWRMYPADDSHVPSSSFTVMQHRHCMWIMLNHRPPVRRILPGYGSDYSQRGGDGL